MKRRKKELKNRSFSSPSSTTIARTTQNINASMGLLMFAESEKGEADKRFILLRVRKIGFYLASWFRVMKL